MYHMVLGARKNNDQGAAILYESSDLTAWKYAGEMTSEIPFGYMWAVSYTHLNKLKGKKCKKGGFKK